MIQYSRYLFYKSADKYDIKPYIRPIRYKMFEGNALYSSQTIKRIRA